MAAVKDLDRAVARDAVQSAVGPQGGLKRPHSRLFGAVAGQEESKAVGETEQRLLDEATVQPETKHAAAGRADRKALV